jgi:hypothetical protein
MGRALGGLRHTRGRRFGLAIGLDLMVRGLDAYLQWSTT